MNEMPSGLFAKAWKVVKRSCDETLAETKLFYKQSVTPSSYNLVTKDSSFTLACLKENKKFSLVLDKIVSPEDYPIVRFCVDQAPNITTGVSNIYSLKKGVNNINSKFDLTDSVWANNDESITVSWSTTAETPLEGLEYVFTIVEAGI